MSKPKLKKYRVYFNSEITGSKVVEAFDEDDAIDQVGGVMDITDFDDRQIYASVNYVEPERKRKTKQ